MRAFRTLSTITGGLLRGLRLHPLGRNRLPFQAVSGPSCRREFQASTSTRLPNDLKHEPLQPFIIGRPAHDVDVVVVRIRYGIEGLGWISGLKDPLAKLEGNDVVQGPMNQQERHVYVFQSLLQRKTSAE